MIKNTKTLITKAEHKNPLFNVYPYLLKDLEIVAANQAWMIDTTAIPMQKSFCLLNIVMDVASRKILSWSISPRASNSFALRNLENALNHYPNPELINLPQNLQYISIGIINLLNKNEIKISVSPKTKCPDNVTTDRFWRSLKYEEVYLKAYQNVVEAEYSISSYIKHYNQHRQNSSIGEQIPNNVYKQTRNFQKVAI